MTAGGRGAHGAGNAATLGSVVASEAPETGRPAPARDKRGVRTAVAGVITALAFLLVWFALVAPNDISRLTPGAFVRIPVEGLVVVALVLVLPPGARRPVAVSVGVVLGLLTVVKIIDTGFFAVLDRPFNPVSDWSYAGPAVGVLSDSI
ncbi:MAG TPA: hypothetical protein VII33_12000, partial [Nakamurella sp.]